MIKSLKIKKTGSPLSPEVEKHPHTTSRPLKALKPSAIAKTISRIDRIIELVLGKIPETRNKPAINSIHGKIAAVIKISMSGSSW